MCSFPRTFVVNVWTTSLGAMILPLILASCAGNPAKNGTAPKAMAQNIVDAEDCAKYEGQIVRVSGVADRLGGWRRVPVLLR